MKAFQFQGTGISSLKEARDFVEQEAKKSEYGVNPEGFVVYYKDVPLCKLKNNSYVQKHGIITGGLLNVRWDLQML